MSSTDPLADGTHYEQVKQLHARGASRDDVLQHLKAEGVDDESAKVLLNAVMGVLPIELPAAQLSPGTNILSPSAFTLSDVGLTGPPTVVGLYWMGFGAAILLALGVATLMTTTELVALPDDVAFYAVRGGGVVSMACLAWGVFRYSQGITIRRK